MKDDKAMELLNEINALIEESNRSMEALNKQLSEAVESKNLEAAKSLLEEKLVPAKEWNAKLKACIEQLESME